MVDNINFSVEKQPLLSTELTMNKQLIAEQLKKQKQEVQKLIQTIGRNRILTLDGAIICKRMRGKTRYYVKRPNDNSPRYLGECDSKLIRNLCTKTYALKLKAAAQKELGQIEGCLKLLESARDSEGKDKADIDTVYNSLPDGIRQNVSPSMYTDDGYAEKWQSEKYQNRWEGKGFLFETARGEKVRSKSEWMIASMLAEAGVPYRYEELIGLHEEFGVHLYPDFTVLNKRTRKIYYWEHFGKMDDPEYVNNSFLPKINDYYNFEYLPGEKLLMTFESKEHPFDTTQVKRLIETFLV